MTMYGKKLEVARLVALCLSSIFYGMEFYSAVMCLSTLVNSLRKQQWTRQTFTLIILTTIFLFNSTSLVIFQLIDMLQAFVWYTGPGGAPDALTDLSYPFNAARAIPVGLQIFTGDAVLTYRCFVVWGRDWKIGVSLAIMAFAALGCNAFTWFYEFSTHTHMLLGPASLVPASLAIACAHSVIGTALLWWKIRYTLRSRSNAPATFRDMETTLSRTLRIIVESCALYTGSLVIYFIIFMKDDTVGSIVSSYTAHAIGLFFNLVTISVHQGRSIESTNSNASDFVAGDARAAPSLTQISVSCEDAT